MLLLPFLSLTTRLVFDLATAQKSFELKLNLSFLRFLLLMGQLDPLAFLILDCNTVMHYNDVLTRYPQEIFLTTPF